ncbi:MAG: hypothetical protein E6370_14175 [Clostridiales bacterium]|jgi:hypothetical protein|nr:hypothetical protein [Clostridiales bacterium]
MKGKISRRILCCYNLFLALGAIWCGTMMVTGALGKYPVEWIGKLPFTNWIFPGIIAIVIYGIGNLLATIFSLSKKDIGVVVSITMGILLLVSMLFSIKMLEEVYLPTIEFIVVSIIQLVLSLFVLMNSYKCTKNKMKSI